MNVKVIDASTLVNYVTIIGKVTPILPEDYMKLTKLAYDFRKAVIYAT